MADVGDIVAALERAGLTDVLGDETTRAAHSGDASLYRLVPLAVVRPQHKDDVAATLETCRSLGVPLTSRGGGTSIAGNAVGAGVLLDFSRHLNRVLEIDPADRSARVEPGVIHAALQREVGAHGLRFGPDPSSHSRCTIGGMIGNNACGSRALAYGRTSDNVLALEVMTGKGAELRLQTGLRGAPTHAGSDATMSALQDAIAGSLATARTEFGRLRRQVSGYAVEHLLPENGFDVGRALIGSEGTLAIVTEAVVRLVADPAYRTLVVLGFPDLVTAADAAPMVLAHLPTACEGLDARIVDVVRRRSGQATPPPLPAGSAWLFVELGGDDQAELADRARRLVGDIRPADSLVITRPDQAAALWRIREDGAGLSGRSPAGKPAYSGWEDAAVAPERLADYLRNFDDLLIQHGLTAMPYGHFGDGCLHARLDFPFDEESGVRRFRAFLDDAADLVVRHEGTLSGEHGDGRARGELLARMYSPDALALFGAIKAAFDPDNILNPGVIVDPEPADGHLRLDRPRGRTSGLALAYHRDGGDFAQAVHRCTGIGKCRAEDTGAGSVMCPSYRATREEKDSTRGRARVLQEMIAGSLVGGWRSTAVHDALDLCLACKGCASDCPTGVDMAAYKAEVLYQTYRRRIRPRSHYALGWLPRWARVASRAPRIANAALAGPPFNGLLKWGAGIDQHRSLPPFAAQTFREWWDGRDADRPGSGKPVVLFVDSFTNHFSPHVGRAIVDVLESAGYTPAVTSPGVCCGLPWISTGQLDAARRILRRAVAALEPVREDGVPIVGIEPSCTAVLRSEVLELVDHPGARSVAESTYTLAELLAADVDWEPPSLSGVEVVAQPHCHQHAVSTWNPDEHLLRRAGARVSRLGGCCGLAGNFGLERGHYDVSVAVAEEQLLPAVRAASADAVILADGFSCRTQLAELSSREGIHLAELLARTGHRDR